MSSSKPAVIAATAAKTTKSTAADTILSDRSDSLSLNKSTISSSGGIVKTVVLPYDEINNIKSELEYLKQYREQQKSLYEEAIQAY